MVPIVKRRSQKPLSPFRRLQLDLATRNEALRQATEQHIEMHVAVIDLLHMVDASSFGGHKTYRCLTPIEQKRLQEIREMAVKP
jgi:hypothetical protein